MRVKYIRVSTPEQNTQRQGAGKYVDRCSGTIPFLDRPGGRKLLDDIEKGMITEVEVENIDRLGRDTINVLQTIEYLTIRGINVISRSENISTLLPSGKINSQSKLMAGLMGLIAEHDLANKKRAQAKGIAIAKANGVYKGKGKPKETINQFLNKPQNAKCLRLLKRGFSIRNSASIAEISLGTSNKINQARKSLEKHGEA